MAWPQDGQATLKTLATGSPELAGRKVAEVTLLGYPGTLKWAQTEGGLRVQLPATAPSEHATTLKIRGIT
jgi:hypothetical protein